MTLIKDKYLTMTAVAEMLGCTERHISDLIIEGELIGLKIGSRAVRISEQSLTDFIKRHTINPDDLFDPDIEKQKQPIASIPKQQQSPEQKNGQTIARSSWMLRR